MPQVFMSPTARSLVENLISSIRANEFGNKNPQPKIVEDEEGHFVDNKSSKKRRMLFGKLEQMKWPREDVERAMKEVISPNEDSEDNFKETFNKLLDWLCLNVPEDRLPQGFQPAKTLEIGVTAFTAAAKHKKQDGILPFLSV